MHKLHLTTWGDVMWTKLFAVVAAALAISASGCATTPPPTQAEIDAYDFGPAPSQQEFNTAVDATIRTMMRDPESARFTYSGDIRRGYWSEFMGPRHWGYYSCGTVNARNGFGGYAGAVAWSAVWQRGQITFREVDSEAGGLVSMRCRQAGF